MDPILKRRLVGAAVLWVAAMLILPWVLDHRSEVPSDAVATAPTDPDREMRTIDLTPPRLRESPSASSSAPAVSEPEPLAEPLPALTEMEDTPENAQPEARSPQKPSAPAAVVAPRPPVVATRPPKHAQPAATPAQVATTKPQPPAHVQPAPPSTAAVPSAPPQVAVTPPPTPSLSASGPAWSVQVGSFGDIQNAQSLAARLLQHQHSAQVSTLVVNGRVLYRVRVGHMGRREDAEALRVRIEQSMGLNGKVVPDP